MAHTRFILIRSRDHFERVQDVLFSLGHYWWDCGTYYRDEVPFAVIIRPSNMPKMSICDMDKVELLALFGTRKDRGVGLLMTLADLERKLGNQKIIKGEYVPEGKRWR